MSLLSSNAVYKHAYQFSLNYFRCLVLSLLSIVYITICRPFNMTRPNGTSEVRKRNSNPGSSSWNNMVVPLIHNTFSNYKLLEKLKWKKFSPKLVGSKVLSFPITPSFPFTWLATCHQNQLLRQKLVTFKQNMVPSNMLECVNECTRRLILSPAYIEK